MSRLSRARKDECIIRDHDRHDVLRLCGERRMQATAMAEGREESVAAALPVSLLMAQGKAESRPEMPLITQTSSPFFPLQLEFLIH